MRDIGKNIKDLRQRKKLTQEELAEQLFVTRQTVSNYELGRTRPDIDMLVRIAEVLDADMNTVIYGIPEVADKKRKYWELAVSAGLLILMTLAYRSFSVWAKELQTMRYIAWPNLLGGILLKPVLFFQLGWTAMQLLGTLGLLSPIGGKKVVYLRPAVWLTAAAYLLLMLPYLSLGAWPQPVPAAWSKAVFYLLDALPGQVSLITNSMLGAAAGVVLWLCRRPRA